MNTLITITEKLLRPIRTKLTQMIQWGVVTRVDTQEGYETLQVAFDSEDIQDNVISVQNYGFSSIPPTQSEAIVLSPCGEREYAFAIAVDSPQNKPKGLKPGEVALYNKAESQIILKETGRLLFRNKDQNLGSILLSLIDQLQGFTVTVPPSTSPTLVLGPDLTSVRLMVNALLEVEP